MPKRNKRSDQDGIYERSDSPCYWASFTDANGKRVRRSTGVRKSQEGRKEAEALLAKWRLEAYRARHWEEVPPKSFDELMLEYLRARRDKRSHRDDLTRARQLRRYFTGAVMNTLRPAEINRYMTERRAEGVAPATVNRELALLSAAINLANRDWEWGLPNPVAGRKLREPEGRIRWITRSEAAALVQAARGIARSPYLADFIVTALHTGCRSGELLGREWRRLDLSAGLIHLEAHHTKAAKRRSVPLNQTARRAILSRARYRAKHCPGTPWVFCRKNGERLEWLQRSFKLACARAGIEDFRIHDLRHTCAAWLVSAGVPLPEVRDLLGHASITMTERYAHLAPDNVRAAVSRLDGDESRYSHAGEEVSAGELREVM